MVGTRSEVDLRDETEKENIGNVVILLSTANSHVLGEITLGPPGSIIYGTKERPDRSLVVPSCL